MPTTSASARLAPLVDAGPALDQQQIERFSRHLLLPELGVSGQRRLIAARVLVIGAGGLGAPVLQYLAAAGVGTIGIVDDDVVDRSNLQRQVIHHDGDIGVAKVASAARVVREINPHVRVIEHGVRLTAQNAEEIFAGYHLVLDGADNFPTRYLVSDTAAQAGIPVVWGSILRFDAQVSVFWNAPVAEDGAALDGVTLRDLFPTPPPPGSTPSCGEAGVLGALCGQVGSLMATEAVKLLTGAGRPLLGRVAVLDVLAPSMVTLPLRGRGQRAVPEDPAQRGYLLAQEEAQGLTLAAVCAQPGGMTEHYDVPQMSVTELSEAMQRREKGEDATGGHGPLTVLDVRRDDEREIAVIDGTEHVVVDEVLADPAGVADRLGLREGTVALHCLSGGRSQRAAEALGSVGVRAVNVAGGIRAWSEQIDPEVPTY